MVLHDWPQIQAEDSVVRIHEVILPENNVEHFEAKMDWHSINLASLERTEEQWRQLTGDVELEVKVI